MRINNLFLALILIAGISYSSISISNESLHVQPTISTSNEAPVVNSINFDDSSISNTFCNNMMNMMFSSFHKGMMSMMHNGSGNHADHHMSSINSDEMPDPESYSAKAFSENCAQCHSLPSPTIHTDKEWPTVVARMLSYINAQNLPSIKESDIKVILDYLIKNNSSNIATKPSQD